MFVNVVCTFTKAWAKTFANNTRDVEGVRAVVEGVDLVLQSHLLTTGEIRHTSSFSAHLFRVDPRELVLGVWDVHGVGAEGVGHLSARPLLLPRWFFSGCTPIEPCVGGFPWGGMDIALGLRPLAIILHLLHQVLA